VLSWFGIEASQAAQYVIAFVIILILAALLGLVLRRLTGGRLMLPGQDRGRARQPRLGIVDIYDLDRQRQLILLRRDNVEHLLLIGGPNDVVIETNIVRVAGARLPAAQNEPALDRSEPAFDNRVTEFPPRPQVEPAGRPSLESQIAARLNDLVARPSERSDSDQELAAIGTITSPSSARVEPPLKPNSVSVSPGPRPGRSEPAAPPPRLGQVPPGGAAGSPA
jgi:flagellar protein FliO/FliZ